MCRYTRLSVNIKVLNAFEMRSRTVGSICKSLQSYEKPLYLEGVDVRLIINLFMLRL